MTTAPVAIFAYNRPRHIEATLNALSQNHLANESEIYIFCDGPKSPADRPEVEQVRAVAREAKGFKSVSIVELPENIGLERSIIGGVSKLLTLADHVIVVEDDILTSRYFLDFLNDGLNCYAQEERVASISGYAYPILAPAVDSYFLRDFECWGWGTWRRVWNRLEWDGVSLLVELERNNLVDTFDYRGAYPFMAMLRDQIAGRTKSWAVRMRANVFLNEWLTLYPRGALTHNFGFDASGTTRGTTTAFDSLLLDSRVGVEHRLPEPDIKAATAVEAFLRSAQSTRQSTVLRKLRRLFARTWKE